MRRLPMNILDRRSAISLFVPDLRCVDWHSARRRCCHYARDSLRCGWNVLDDIHKHLFLAPTQHASSAEAPWGPLAVT